MFARGKLQGLSIFECEHIISKYSHGFLADFILYLEDLISIKSRYDKIRMAECFYIATIGSDSKKGHNQYKNWVKENLPKNEVQQCQETLFQKAKRLRNN